MATATKRTTIYLDSDLHKSLRLKAVETASSVSELVNNAVRESIAEDAEDVAAYADRKMDPLISYDEMLKKLKKMAEYKIYFCESVAKDLSALPKSDGRKILQRVQGLGANPRPVGC
ncbi:MAG TPA: hypothetical protein VK445_04520 [Dissulfurispiraceae bacterium]|nr:hypothetical protein [Dissulfurispiraceae bacterium]